MPGWVIRMPRTRTSELGGEVLERELLGARAVADDQVAAARRTRRRPRSGPRCPSRPTYDGLKPCSANHGSAVSVSIRRSG